MKAFAIGLMPRHAQVSAQMVANEASAQRIRLPAARVGQGNDVAIAPDQFTTGVIEGQARLAKLAKLPVPGFHADKLQRRDRAFGDPEPLIDLIFGRTTGQIKAFDLEQVALLRVERIQRFVGQWHEAEAVCEKVQFCQSRMTDTAPSSA